MMSVHRNIRQKYYNMPDIIQASNQQFLGVLLFNTALMAVNAFIYATNVIAISSGLVGISCAFVIPSLFMGFAYLMLFTSTYEHTGSYQEAYAVCNNLALTSAITSFVGAQFTVGAIVTHLFGMHYNFVATLLCVSVVVGMVVIANVVSSWRRAISVANLRLGTTSSRKQGTDELFVVTCHAEEELAVLAHLTNVGATFLSKTSITEDVSTMLYKGPNSLKSISLPGSAKIRIAHNTYAQ